MQLIVTLRKEVADADAGRTVLDMVKQKLTDHPEVTITGHVTSHFDLEPPPEPPE